MRRRDQKDLLSWYQKNHRPLPWRQNRDPYSIWISETMLQQTTSTAVIPYFERFLDDFPDLKSLATAPENKVIAAWAGLGYYSRARNLHKAAKRLSKLQEFPKTFNELMKYPGIGPYTARAVSSLAFSESVGVLDGNVIRVLSRKEDLPVLWWQTKGRKQLQDLADLAVASVPSEKMNQALMELGATICLPQNPKCILCPWTNSCAANENNNIAARPLKKPKREKEIWFWQPIPAVHRGRIALVKNDYAPFLRQHWFLPGQVRKKDKKPKTYDFRHSITHHDIYVKLADTQKTLPESIKKKYENSEVKWVIKSEVANFIPASLITKVIDRL